MHIRDLQNADEIICIRNKGTICHGFGLKISFASESSRHRRATINAFREFKQRFNLNDADCVNKPEIVIIAIKSNLWSIEDAFTEKFRKSTEIVHREDVYSIDRFLDEKIVCSKLVVDAVYMVPR